MKIDRVLRMEEFLHRCCVVPMHVNPSAGDVRHVPIMAPATEHCVPRFFFSKKLNRMEYAIAFGVVAIWACAAAPPVAGIADPGSE